MNTPVFHNLRSRLGNRVAVVLAGSIGVAIGGPAQFTKTYDSAGGSITVTWSGTAFSLDAVNAAAGHDVEIKDQRWDRIRVEFRGDTDSRIEVRLSDDDNTIRVRID